MSIATIHQDFKVIKNGIEGLKIQDGSLEMNTDTNGSVSINQNGNSRILVNEDGALQFQAKENQDINLNVSGTGKINIDGLPTKELVTLDHALGAIELNYEQADGAAQILVSGISESKATACFMCVRIEGQSGICSPIATLSGQHDEGLSLDWDDKFTLRLNGALSNYLNGSSDFKITVLK